MIKKISLIIIVGVLLVSLSSLGVFAEAGGENDSRHSATGGKSLLWNDAGNSCSQG